jgi:hypothetical protein
MADVRVAIPRLSADEAYDHVVAWLRHQASLDTLIPGWAPLEVRLRQIIDGLLVEAQENWKAAHPGQGVTVFRLDPRENTGPLHEVAWQLVRRGILVPMPRLHRQSDSYGLEDAFHITPHGMRWLGSHPDDVVSPVDGSRFASVLRHHAARFGALYEMRALEAHACYQAQLYLGCCAMTGAAAEAIVAAILVERVGVEKANTLLNGAGWRKKSLDALKHDAAPGHAARLDSFLELLNRWRDSAVHNREASPTEEEAFMSMLLLLRFVLFADEQWPALTGRPSQ